MRIIRLLFSILADSNWVQFVLRAPGPTDSVKGEVKGLVRGEVIGLVRGEGVW